MDLKLNVIKTKALNLYNTEIISRGTGERQARRFDEYFSCFTWNRRLSHSNEGAGTSIVINKKVKSCDFLKLVMSNQYPLFSLIIYNIYQSDCKIKQTPHLHLYSLKSLFTFKQKPILAICCYLFFRFLYVKK